MRTPFRKSGFTVLEALVAIAVLGLLAAILFPVFGQARSQARRSVCIANMRQIAMASSLYMDDYDGMFPRCSMRLPDGSETTLGRTAIAQYQAALRPYAGTGGGEENRFSFWWDLSDPDRMERHLWGSFVQNGLLTSLPRHAAQVANPTQTIYATLRAASWSRVTGVTPPPAPSPADPFWTSEYFDMSIDPYERTQTSSFYFWMHGRVLPPCSLFASDPLCRTWSEMIDQRRYAGRTLFAYADGHIRAFAFPQTYRSPLDNDWDMH
jgi:prepilin-type N-terminal cleavage/methylation domain-containing protein